ncbi:DNA topology modulation protein FlaR [Aliiroseovarius crassostreae]|uniref:DNA topology modulation protein FlaR n=1 Tax=Aliiroseovarius crassostreae TaxID=154981 RepID=UPI002200F7CD|nr:DNA topology modulation protein FlaR [Aliiroseovarius crassostreae]UWQ06055.1 DNA topology modulation protein FlaR [Aliiroseovarius crassostreae]
MDDRASRTEWVGIKPNRILVTGANGAGKSHFSARLAALGLGYSLVSFDALKLTTDWVLRPRKDIEAALQEHLDRECWIIEGGPSMLPLALPKADVLIWLDPPFWKRAMRLMLRPIRNRGKTRKELPPGNVDWPLEQYGFAVRSLWKHWTFRKVVGNALRESSDVFVVRCRTEDEIESVLASFAN